jgi:hypothetical protein
VANKRFAINKINAPDAEGYVDVTLAEVTRHDLLEGKYQNTLQSVIDQEDEKIRSLLDRAFECTKCHARPIETIGIPGKKQYICPNCGTEYLPTWINQ